VQQKCRKIIAVLSAIASTF